MKNKLHVDEKTYKNILRWLRIQTIFLIIATMVSFCLVEWGINDYKFSFDLFLKSLGIIIPMCIFITIVNTINARWFAKQSTDLADGLAKAAEGDYHAKLDPSKASIFAVAYENFNKLEERLKKTGTLQDEFVNNYSHEFKTPITSIKGFAELLLEEDLDEKTRKKYLKIIVEESRKLTSLSEQSILLTKLNAQNIIPNKKKYSLDEQIRNCVIMQEPSCLKKNITINCDLDKVTIFQSEAILEHLWNNLISNAIKYSNQDGKIDITLTSDNNSIVVKVKDNGIGMSEDSINQIFDRFYQVDKSKTIDGLGLGLTIVGRIIELVEGKITVESELGKGSVFTVTLHKDQKHLLRNK